MTEIERAVQRLLRRRSVLLSGAAIIANLDHQLVDGDWCVVGHGMEIASDGREQDAAHR